VGLNGWDFVAQGKERCLFVYGLEFCAIYIGSCLEDFSFSLLHFKSSIEVCNPF
jgi:hypothetical protein